MSESSRGRRRRSTEGSPSRSAGKPKPANQGGKKGRQVSQERGDYEAGTEQWIVFDPSNPEFGNVCTDSVCFQLDDRLRDPTGSVLAGDEGGWHRYAISLLTPYTMSD
eukprot:966389-Rhodomonas_salina.2